MVKLLHDCFVSYLDLTAAAAHEADQQSETSHTQEAVLRKMHNVLQSVLETRLDASEYYYLSLLIVLAGETGK